MKMLLIDATMSFSICHDKTKRFTEMLTTTIVIKIHPTQSLKSASFVSSVWTEKKLISIELVI